MYVVVPVYKASNNLVKNIITMGFISKNLAFPRTGNPI
jgi:hypothetical protein